MTQTKFTEWMAKVDAALLKATGLDSRDLPDWDYVSAYEDGFTPSAAARAARRAAEDF